MFLEFGSFFNFFEEFVMKNSYFSRSFSFFVRCFFLASVAVLTACGGGGESSVSASVVPPVVQVTDYSCDKAATLAAAPHSVLHFSRLSPVTTVQLQKLHLRQDSGTEWKCYR